MNRSKLSRSLQVLSAVVAVVGLVQAPSLTHADVTGEGDVLPAGPTLLPLSGGVVEGDIIVGGTGDLLAVTTVGKLTIDEPSFTLPLSSANGYIGNNYDGVGQAAVAGFTSEWRLDNILGVGVRGQGYLNITSGAVVRTNFVGEAMDADTIVGQFESSQGYVTVAGSGSKLRNTNLTVGFQGFGRIDATTGAWIETEGEAILGEEVDLTGVDNAIGAGHVVVDGQGSRWHVGIINTVTPDAIDGELTIGLEGRGTLEVRNQALVRVETDTLIGGAAGSHGEAIVTGQDSQFWTIEDLYVGNAAGTATGELRVGDRAVVRAGGAPGGDVNGTLVGTRGLVELTGGTLLTPEVINNGIMRGYGRIEAPLLTNNSDIRNAAGLANVRERLWFTGAVVNNDNIESLGGEMEFEGLVTNNTPEGDIFGVDAVFRFMGGIVNNSRITVDDTLIETLVFMNNAVLAVGASDATYVLGDLDLSGASSLRMELGDQFSMLSVSGDALLGGELRLSLADDFLPKTGDSFKILESDNLSGMFATEILTDNPLLLWDVEYTSTSVFVTFGAAAPPGMGADFNGDNIVDGNDLAIWKSNFGLGTNPPPPATQADGDANGDGVVDGADFLLIQQKLGGPPSVAAAGAVPEPGALALAVMALVPLWRRAK